MWAIFNCSPPLPDRIIGPYYINIKKNSNIRQLTIYSYQSFQRRMKISSLLLLAYK